MTAPLLLLTALAHLAIVASSLEPPSISPMRNTPLPLDSSENVTYTCMTDYHERLMIIWQLNGRQIQGSMAIATYNSIGVFIEDTVDMGKAVSYLTVTQQGRGVLGRDPIPVLCLVFNETDVTISGGEQYHIIQFDAPSPPGNLQLNYQSEDQLILQWERPAKLHDDVDVTYLIQIADLASGNITEYETTATYILINQTVDEQCQRHIFTVTARNDAGVSNGTSIQESIPISPGVSPIARSQKVEQVVFSNTSVNITISFEPATNCSTQFPVINYTVSIEGLEGSLTIEDASDYSSALSVVLSSSAFPDLVQDQQYSIIITACTNFTCRSPPEALTAVTTGVQSASAVFYDTTASLNCTFAIGSSSRGRGCVFVFALTNENETENFTVSLSEGDVSNASCAELSNTRGAYDMAVLVYDLETDGSVGNQSVMAMVTMEMDPNNFPCPLPSVPADDGGDGGISAGAIVGIVLVSVVAVGALVFLVAALLFLCHLKRKLKRTRPEAPKLKWTDFVDEVNIVVEKVKGALSTDGPEVESIDGSEDKNAILLQDQGSVEKEDFPVAMVVKDGKSVTLQLFDSHAVRQWIESWPDGSRTQIELYPRK